MNAVTWSLVGAATGSLLYSSFRYFWRSWRLEISRQRLRRALNDAREVARIRRGWRS